MAEFEDSRAPDISVPMDRNKNKIDHFSKNKEKTINLLKKINNNYCSGSVNLVTSQEIL